METAIEGCRISPSREAGQDCRIESGEGAFVARHQTALWRYLRYLGCADDRTEDYLQDAFLAALEHGIASQPSRQARAWLRTTVRNLLFHDLRQTARRPARVALDLAQLDSGFCEHGERLPDYLAALERCVRGLSPRDRSALEQRYRLGWSRRRMAKTLGLSAAGVKSLLQRIRQRLKADVEREIEENER